MASEQTTAKRASKKKDSGPAPEPSTIDPAAVIVDRDTLRELRMSEAAIEVANAAKGDAALAEVRARKTTMPRVNPYDLHFEPDHNPRDFTTAFMRRRVASYAHSIAMRGVRLPLDVYVKSGVLYVNNGETRWRATMHALNFLNVKVEGLAIVISHGENEAERLIGQWLGNDTIQFEPIEEAVLFRRYMDLGADPSVFARRIGHAPGYISDRIRLLEMPHWLQDKVSKGAVPPRVAYEEIWLPAGENSAKAKELLTLSAEKASEEGALTVRPRHVRAAKTGEISTTIVRIRLHDKLAAILERHSREVIIQWFGQDDAEALFKLAKLAKPKVEAITGC
jgi:hypothetical protein